MILMLAPMLAPMLSAGGGVATAQAIPAADALAQARAMTGAVQRCARSTRADTITVCGRRGVDPRIPDVIRAEPRPRRAGAATAWGTRNADLDEGARGGRPGSSSPDGSGGQSGWAKQLRREWEAERQAIDRRTATRHMDELEAANAGIGGGEAAGDGRGAEAVRTARDPF